MTPDEIKAIRQQFGASQEELARLLGINAGTVSRWERGLSTPHRQHERRLRSLALDTAELDGELVMGYATADSMTQDAMDAVRAAEDQGLSPLAMWMAGSAAREYGNGVSASTWILSKQHLGVERVERVIAELESAKLWPWG